MLLNEETERCGSADSARWQDSHSCTKRRLRGIFESAYTGEHSKNGDECETRDRGGLTGGMRTLWGENF